jgi:hypothetical protein
VDAAAVALVPLVEVTTMPTSLRMAAVLSLLLAAGPAASGEHVDDEFALFSPDRLQWQAGPSSLPAGAKLAVLEGDPTKEGPFVMRLRLPDGYTIPPHTHPKK